MSLLILDHADEVLNLGDHAANRGSVLQFGDAADLIELPLDRRAVVR